MEKNKFHIYMDLIRKSIDEFKFDCDIFEKTEIIALLVHNLFGGDIYALTSHKEPIYYNKIDDEYYDFVFEDTPFNYNLGIKMEDDMDHSNYVLYVAYMFKIEIIKKYMDYIVSCYATVGDYLRLRDMIPFFEYLQVKSVINNQADGDISNVDDTIKLYIANMEKNCLNVQDYLKTENTLFDTEKELEEFKARIFGKKMKKTL